MKIWPSVSSSENRNKSNKRTVGKKYGEKRKGFKPSVGKKPMVKYNVEQM